MKRFILLAFISIISGFRPASAQLLVEGFRSTGCVNCIDADKKYEDFVNANPNLNISLIYIHNNIAVQQDDPFYIASKPDVDYRMGSTYYKVFGDPDFFISGFNGGVGIANEANWEKLSKDPASAQYLGVLSATASVNGSGTLTVDIHAAAPSQTVQVVPYAMLVESGIFYANTDGYGNPPDSIWNNIFRAMIPGAQGGGATSWSGAKDFHYTLETSGKPWNLNNCKLYIFLQETAAQSAGSHAIDAFTTVSITTSAVKDPGHSDLSWIGNPIPNPSSVTAQIPFYAASAANVKIVISDDLGRDEQTIYNRFTEGAAVARFVPANHTRGIYYARMYAGGSYIGMQKIVFAP